MRCGYGIMAVRFNVVIAVNCFLMGMENYVQLIGETRSHDELTGRDF